MRAAGQEDLLLLREVLRHTGGTTGVPERPHSRTRIYKKPTLEQCIAWVSVLHGGAEVFYCILPLFHAFGFTASATSWLRLKRDHRHVPGSTRQPCSPPAACPASFFLGVPHVRTPP